MDFAPSQTCWSMADIEQRIRRSIGQRNKSPNISRYRPSDPTRGSKLDMYTALVVELVSRVLASGIGCDYMKGALLGY